MGNGACSSASTSYHWEKQRNKKSSVTSFHWFLSLCCGHLQISSQWCFVQCRLAESQTVLERAPRASPRPASPGQEASHKDFFACFFPEIDYLRICMKLRNILKKSFEHLLSLYEQYYVLRQFSGWLTFNKELQLLLRCPPLWLLNFDGHIKSKEQLVPLKQPYRHTRGWFV